MWSLLGESSIVGFITFILGTIIFNLSINKKNIDKNKPYGINFAFFMTGFILHLLLKFSGFNQWYCTKEQCRSYQIISKI